MEKILWSNKLNTGVKKIDDQHKRLVKLVNNLVSAIQEGYADDITADICRELAEYAAYHFRDEEMLMEEVGFPGLEDQRHQHAELADTVQGHLASFNEGDPTSPLQLLDFLRGWLIHHIVNSDMKIGQHIRNQQKA